MHLKYCLTQILFLQLKHIYNNWKPAGCGGMHAYNLNTWETEVGGSPWIQNQTATKWDPDSKQKQKQTQKNPWSPKQEMIGLIIARKSSANETILRYA